MSDLVRITDLPPITGNVSTDDVLPFVDISGNTTYKIELGQIKDFVLSGLSDYYLTGATFNDVTNTITLSDNDNNEFDITLNSFSGLSINGVLTATTIDLCSNSGVLYTSVISGCSPINILNEINVSSSVSATTYYGDGSNLININGYSSTTVNISSAQILSMGTTPIELLPAAGVGKYYDIENICIEGSGGVGYSFGVHTGVSLYLSSNSGYISEFIDPYIMSDGESQFCFTPDNYWYVYPNVGTPSNRLVRGYGKSNDNLILTLIDSANNVFDPTLGDGTMRVIISYKVRTFGA